jgi:hypothetical protein
MSLRKYLYLSLFIFSCALLIHIPGYAEESKNDSSLDKNKQEILNDLELFEHNINSTKSCVSQARTDDELKKCRIDETRIKFQRVQDDLIELDMTPQQRRLYELRPQR